MASSFVFYKFKSQREPSRVAFDGTAISVWDLKKEIIAENRMGRGADFDFAIYNADTEEGAFPFFSLFLARGLDGEKDHLLFELASCAISSWPVLRFPARMHLFQRFLMAVFSFARPVEPRSSKERRLNAR
jgi:hypothetical protein